MTDPSYLVDFPRPKLTIAQIHISKKTLGYARSCISQLITKQIKSDLKKLFDEGALISRFYCKTKKKFRGEKLIRRLKQITVSIRKLYTINISNVVEIFSLTFDNGIPNKKARQWVGSRILAVTNLIDQLQEFSKGIVQLIIKLFQSGQSWLEMNIALAMVSRVWILSTSLHKLFLNSYKHYISLEDRLKEVKLPTNSHIDSLDNSQSESDEEFVARPGSVMCRKPEPEESILKKRKRSRQQIRLLQEKNENKIEAVKRQKRF